MNTRKDLIRMAGKIFRHLGRFSRTVPDDLVEAVHALLEDHESFRNTWSRLQKARGRGWDLAAGQVQPDLMYEATQLKTRIDRLLAYRDAPRLQTATLLTVLAELQQLELEFDDVEMRLKERQIVAKTESIELEGVYLGPFAIELHIDRLSRSVDSRGFDCVALDPNPANCNSGVTHPHVQDKVLCAGDASGSISQALKQGRIADAFCLVRSVLLNYNPASPYVALNSWNGEYCHDCDNNIDADDACSCDHCDNHFCDHCMSGCDLCDRSCCRGCIDKDPVSQNNVCPACRNLCSECRRVVDKDSFHSESELCPECHKKHEAANQENEHETEEKPLEPALAQSGAGVDALAPGVAEAPVPAPRRRHRNRRVRRQPRGEPVVC